jgi:YbgC/YbaW family acyl-CoA thioester hydrolase
MARSFTCRFRVQFADTDMAGIMHFANFFRYMEETEHAFLRSLDLSVNVVHEGIHVTWPRVHAECDYKSPLRFEDEFDVVLTIREKREKALIFDFSFLKAVSDTEVATGSITAVCVTHDKSAGTMKAIPIPTFIAERLA